MKGLSSMSQDIQSERIYYNKLVRDHIPEIIRAHGDTCHTEVLNAEEYQGALKNKLIEEAQEVASATSNADLLMEIADVYEVLTALCRAHNFSPETVMLAQQQKRDTNGAFEQRIKLCWTE